MKGNDKLIILLNVLLAQEHTSIAQYVIHANMFDHWGYEDLYEYEMKRAHAEMRHAAMLVERILVLEGVPVLSKLNNILIGTDAAKMLGSDRMAEIESNQTYNSVIAVAAEVGDGATRKMLESIVKDEDKHLIRIEEKLAQIAQMGLGTFLSTKN